MTFSAKVKRRLTIHAAPEKPQDITDDNHKWLAPAAIHQGGHRDQCLVKCGPVQV